MRSLGDGLKIRYIIPRVTDAFDVDGLGAVVDGGGEVLGRVTLDELGLDAEAGQQHLELVVGAAVQVRRRDDVVAGARERRDGHELRGLAGRRRERRHAALEGCDALLEDIDRRLFGYVAFMVSVKVSVSFCFFLFFFFSSCSSYFLSG